MVKQKRNKPKYIDDKLSFDAMVEFTQRLHITNETAFPGYLRQRIYIERIIGENYIVHGECSLNQEHCAHAVSPNCVYSCSLCPVYKEVFNNATNNKYSK